MRVGAMTISGGRVLSADGRVSGKVLRQELGLLEEGQEGHVAGPE